LSAGLGGAAIIILDDTAGDIAALDRSSVMGLAVGDRATLVNALMRALNIVIAVG
jgi:PIN domain nuclease of toxin-antitoxin system